MIRINLLTEERGKKGKGGGMPVMSAPSGGGGGGSAQAAVFGAILAVFLLVGAGVWGYYFMQIGKMEDTIAKQKIEKEKYKDAHERVKKLEQKKAEFANKLEQITLLKERQSLPVRLMGKLVDVLPEGAWYSSMTASQAGAVKISGKARSIKTISTYYDNVVALSDFSGVQQGNIKKESGALEVYTFDITFTFVAGVPKPQEIGAASMPAPKPQPVPAAKSGGKADI